MWIHNRAKIKLRTCICVRQFDVLFRVFGILSLFFLAALADHMICGEQQQHFWADTCEVGSAAFRTLCFAK